VTELPLVGATATHAHAAAFTGGDGSPIGKRRGGMTAVPADVERSPETGRPVAALVTPVTKPEQSVPRGESPPETYGVPATEFTSVNSVTVANMPPDATRGFCSAPKSVTPFTTRVMYRVLHEMACTATKFNQSSPLRFSSVSAGDYRCLPSQ
jgi:hypothetical protein